MNIIKSSSLGAVVLPLVRVMAEADLSWSDRETVSAALQACHAQWATMEKERQTINQTNAGQQLSGTMFQRPDPRYTPPDQTT